MERLNVAGKILHRTCFRCARCQSQLSIANYYETEKEGTYCCEMCPDEEHLRESEVAMAKMTLERNIKLEAVQSDADEDDSSDEHDEIEKRFEVTGVEKHPATKQEANSESSLPESQQEAEDKLVLTIISDEHDGCEEKTPIITMDEALADPKPIIENIDESPSINEVDKNCEDHEVLKEGNTESKSATNIISSMDDNSAPMLRPECDQTEVNVEEQEDNSLEHKKEDICSTESTTEQAIYVENYDNQSKSSNQELQECNDIEEKVDTLLNINNNAPGVEIVMQSTQPEIVHGSPEEKGDNANKLSYPDERNPFGDEASEDDEKPVTLRSQYPDESKSEEKSPTTQRVVSTNPFGSDFEDSENEEQINELRIINPSAALVKGPPKPPRAPSIRQSLNPFGSDFEDDDENTNASTNNIVVSPNSRLSASYVNVALRSPPSPASSTGSRNSSRVVNKKKKRPAPKPPSSDVEQKPSLTSSTSVNPIVSQKNSVNPVEGSPIPAPRNSKLPGSSSKSSSVTSAHRPPPRPPPPVSIPVISPSSRGDLPKSRKDRDNLNRRSQCMIQMGQVSSVDTPLTYHSTHNSNIGSAGTSDVDSSSIMSGSITSTR